MNKYIKCYLVVLLSFSLLMLAACEPSNTNAQVTNKIDVQTFNSKFSLLKENFKPEGYVEVTEDWNIRNIVPAINDEPKESLDQFHDNNKTLVYKNEKNGVVIMLGVAPGPEGDFQWTNSVSYSPNFYNSKDENNGITRAYSDKFPNTFVNVYNFSGNGLSVSMVAMTLTSQDVDVQKLYSEFLMMLLNYLNKKS
ncbi:MULTISPECIES: hypothetical protein [unclassified Brevibacillus]|uniref:hypothetical protein n=1 Tax=unclassified Brevibacillus TaxID=2684853 RepID=UPI00156B20F3|nr:MULTISPECIES: hypothetical protein [unclassified Brevibacillus]MCC8434095.1 hypothetical protein [Brevibacillus sp. M2.1A]NRR23394.1 hypothetical protein [Brevibacillus sp. MS2.2]